VILKNEFCENLAFFFCKELEEFPKQVCTKITYTPSKKLGIIKIITGNGGKDPAGEYIDFMGVFSFSNLVSQWEDLEDDWWVWCGGGWRFFLGGERG